MIALSRGSFRSVAIAALKHGEWLVSARGANRNSEIRLRPEVCRVAVAYEDALTRDYSIQLCDNLSQKFEGDLEFEFTWWGFKYLGDAEIAAQAAQAAIQADLIIVCVHRAESFSFEVQRWFEQWSSERADAEGALVVVEVFGESGQGVSTSQEKPLRTFAQRAKLDYLTIPVADSGGTPSNVASEPALPREIRFEERYHSSGWGINE